MHAIHHYMQNSSYNVTKDTGVATLFSSMAVSIARPSSYGTKQVINNNSSYFITCKQQVKTSCISRANFSHKRKNHNNGYMELQKRRGIYAGHTRNHRPPIFTFDRGLLRFISLVQSMFSNTKSASTFRLSKIFVLCLDYLS